jgi:hypothetical protein
MAISKIVTNSVDSGVTLTSPTLASPTISAPVLSGSATGTYTIAGTYTLAGTPTTGASLITSGTAQATTSGTFKDFTGIPSWVKRITVMFSATSTNGASQIQVQIGNGSFVTSGYSNYAAYISTSTVSGISSTSGFVTQTPATANTLYGSLVIHNLSGNVWVSNHTIGDAGATLAAVGGGGVTLGGTLDRVRITTVNGTDTFDAGSINLLYE